MLNTFTHTKLGSFDLPVCRLGLSGTYRPGKETIHRAIELGTNFFFLFGIDMQTIRVLRSIVKHERGNYIVSTGAYNYIFAHGNVRKTCEKRLRQLKTDYLDIFSFLGVMSEKEFPYRVRDDLYRLKEEGKVRAVGISTHDRLFAGKLAAEGALDVLMIRYNAAHPGAEQDIFPFLSGFRPGIVAYTATRWRRLLRRPKTWSKDLPVPDPRMAYRFVLTNPAVNVCLTAPSNRKQLEENWQALADGPLSTEEMIIMRKFGAIVHKRNKWFM